MSSKEIDDYLNSLDEPKRTTLTVVRDTIAELIPEAEQGFSYGMPAFKLRGKTVAGFAAFKDHLSYTPHSGSVLPKLAADLSGYSYSKSALRFPVDEPLPAALVKKLLDARIAEAFSG